MKFGRFYNEFGGFRIRDIIAIWIDDFPVFVIRKYQDNHSATACISYSLAVLGFSWLLTFGDKTTEGN